MRETRRANSLAARSADGERMDRTVPMAAAQSFHSERKALCWPRSYRSPTTAPEELVELERVAVEDELFGPLGDLVVISTQEDARLEHLDRGVEAVCEEGVCERT